MGDPLQRDFPLLAPCPESCLRPGGQGIGKRRRLPQHVANLGTGVEVAIRVEHRTKVRFCSRPSLGLSWDPWELPAGCRPRMM
jgi:hypothetical protein